MNVKMSKCTVSRTLTSLLEMKGVILLTFQSYFKTCSNVNVYIKYEKNEVRLMGRGSSRDRHSRNATALCL